MSFDYKELLGEGKTDKDQSELNDEIDAHEDKIDGAEDELAEAAMLRMATAFSILGEEVDSMQLQEAQSIVRLNKQAKLSSLTVRMSLLLARAKNDPLYTKYSKFNGMRLQLREQIIKKYGQKAVQRARALLSGQTVDPLNVKK